MDDSPQHLGPDCPHECPAILAERHRPTEGTNREEPELRLTNDCYLITLHAGAGVEHYFRDGPIWIKRSMRGRRFEATAEQVLNHLLPALADVKPGMTATVEHRDMSESTALTLDSLRERSAKDRRRAGPGRARRSGP